MKLQKPSHILVSMAMHSVMSVEIHRGRMQPKSGGGGGGKLCIVELL